MTTPGKHNYKHEFLYLTTVGRKTGELHEIEIWFAEHKGQYYLVSENRERSHWVQNIQHDPRITFWVKGKTYQGTGRAIDADKEVELVETVSALMDAKYSWSEGLIVELTPGE